MIESAGSFAIGTQIMHLVIVTAASYGLAFGLKQGRRSFLSLGMCTRNIGAALGPLHATPGVDQRALVMVTVAFPLMVMISFLAGRLFVARASIGDQEGGLCRSRKGRNYVSEDYIETTEQKGLNHARGNRTLPRAAGGSGRLRATLSLLIKSVPVCP
jgi:hypothetical protein